jgi:hypothetical protein
MEGTLMLQVMTVIQPSTWRLGVATLRWCSISLSAVQKFLLLLEQGKAFCTLCAYVGLSQATGQ